MDITNEKQARICLECKHIWYSAAYRGYSECTPGGYAEMECDKYHWHWEQHDDTKGTLRDKLITARTCQDYDPDEELASIGKRSGSIPEREEVIQMRISMGAEVRVKNVTGCPIGIVVQDSSDRSLVEFPTAEGVSRDWYKNADLEVVREKPQVKRPCD